MSTWNPFSKKHEYKDPANVRSLPWTEIIRLNPEKVDKNIVEHPGFFNLKNNQRQALIELVRIKNEDKKNKSLSVEMRQRELEDLVTNSERRISRLIAEDKKTNREANEMVSQFMAEEQMKAAEKISKRLPDVPTGPIIVKPKTIPSSLGGTRKNKRKNKRKSKTYKTKSKNKHRRTFRSKK
jgi:hypothetical protein